MSKMSECIGLSAILGVISRTGSLKNWGAWQPVFKRHAAVASGVRIKEALMRSISERFAAIQKVLRVEPLPRVVSGHR
jgi:hypothetical protein